MIYFDLLIGFLEVGFFSFGGAYAAIPLIREVVLAHGWMDEEMVTYMIAISESTPGPIMVNMATYVGSVKGGIPGALIATTATVLPAFLIILLIMVLFKKALQNKYVKAALGGLKPCVIGLILSTGIMMIIRNCNISLKAKPDVLTIGLTCVLAAVYFG
ncbi:MAG: chromate transporter, partial [Acetatifactor sp.]|nr:chromate transporter [Acetatifactor sp.]